MQVSRRFFHGRVVLTDHSTLMLFFLSGCFLLGALLGHCAAGTESVLQNRELQDYLASFVSMIQRHELVRSSMGYTLFSYCKYPILIFAFGFTSFGIFLIPAVTVYQGFAISFAVSAFLYTAPEYGFLLALLLFGLRYAVVLPCFFLLARDAVASSAKLPARRQGKNDGGSITEYAVLRFALCMLFLFVGAFLEHTFLPDLLFTVA